MRPSSAPSYRPAPTPRDHELSPEQRLPVPPPAAALKRRPASAGLIQSRWAKQVAEDPHVQRVLNALPLQHALLLVNGAVEQLGNDPQKVETLIKVAMKGGGLAPPVSNSSLGSRTPSKGRPAVSFSRDVVHCGRAKAGIESAWMQYAPNRRRKLQQEKQPLAPEVVDEVKDITSWMQSLEANLVDDPRPRSRGQHRQQGTFALWVSAIAGPPNPKSLGFPDIGSPCITVTVGPQKLSSSVIQEGASPPVLQFDVDFQWPEDRTALIQVQEKSGQGQILGFLEVALPGLEPFRRHFLGLQLIDSASGICQGELELELEYCPETTPQLLVRGTDDDAIARKKPSPELDRSILALGAEEAAKACDAKCWAYLERQIPLLARCRQDRQQLKMQQLRPSRTRSTIRSLSKSKSGTRRQFDFDSVEESDDGSLDEEEQLQLAHKLFVLLRAKVAGRDLRGAFQRFDTDIRGHWRMPQLRRVVRSHLHISDELVPDRDLEFLCEALDLEKVGSFSPQDFLDFLEQGPRIMVPGCLVSEDERHARHLIKQRFGHFLNQQAEEKAAQLEGMLRNDLDEEQGLD